MWHGPGRGFMFPPGRLQQHIFRARRHFSEMFWYLGVALQERLFVAMYASDLRDTLFLYLVADVLQVLESLANSHCP